jgi:hypothetical protein
VDEKPISTARAKLYALRDRAPQRIKEVPPWVWAAVMVFVLVTIAAVAVTSLSQRSQPQ